MVIHLWIQCGLGSAFDHQIQHNPPEKPNAAAVIAAWRHGQALFHQEKHGTCLRSKAGLVFPSPHGLIGSGHCRQRHQSKGRRFQYRLDLSDLSKASWHLKPRSSHWTSLRTMALPLIRCSRELERPVFHIKLEPSLPVSGCQGIPALHHPPSAKRQGWDDCGKHHSATFVHVGCLCVVSFAKTVQQAQPQPAVAPSIPGMPSS